jgi:pimeloyl-ACP methyl ester carboxylesterase
MLFMPLNVPIVWLVGLLSIGILGEGIYMVYEWYIGELVEMSYLVGGLAVILWSFGGRWIGLPLFRRLGVDEPKYIRSGTVQRVPRPDGTVLHVEFYGPEDGQPIILSHGWGSDSTVWYYAKRQLSAHFRVIVWDLPGLGKSSKPKNNDYSLERYARDLEVVVNLVGKPVILLGHSMGGMLILTFCRLFPEHLGRQVTGLILVDTTFINPVKTSIFSKFLRTIQKPLLEPLLYLTIGLSPIVWLMTWLSYLNGLLHISVELLGYTGTQTRGQLEFSALLSALPWPAVLARGTLAMFKYNETATLSTIDVPVLLIVGASDIVTRPTASIRMKAELPQSDLVILKRSGHMSLIEQNQRFAKAVRKFSVACL